MMLIFNMAMDEVLSQNIRKLSPPTIRLYNWKPSAVSIGYFQGIKDVVNLEACKEKGIDCVRRWTGGGAVYHDHKGEITVCPEHMFPKSIIESYRLICG